MGWGETAREIQRETDTLRERQRDRERARGLPRVERAHLPPRHPVARHGYSPRERERDRQTDRLIDSQRDSGREREGGGETETETERTGERERPCRSRQVHPLPEELPLAGSDQQL